MPVKLRSAALFLKLKPARGPRKTNRAGTPLETHFREAAA